MYEGYKREYKREYEQLLFIFTKLHTDLCSYIVNKIKFKDDSLLRSLIKDDMLMYLLGDLDYQYLFKNRDMIPIIREELKSEFKHERELKRKHELKIKREREIKFKEYTKIGLCIGTIAFAYLKK